MNLCIHGKGSGLLMNRLIFGWLACACFILACSYSLFKRFKGIRSKIYLPAKNLIDYHCTFSILATILAFIHAEQYISNIRFSTGYVSLLLLVVVTLFRIIMKYFKKVYKHKMFLLYTHILLVIMLTGTILLHIFNYLLLQ